MLFALCLVSVAAQAQTATDPANPPNPNADRRVAPNWNSEKRVIDVQVTAARQSDYVREMIRKEGGSDVPVLLPYSMSKDEATAQSYQMRLKLRRDDYTIVLHQPQMDIVIIGTSNYFPGQRQIRTDRQEDYMMPYERFTDGEGGAFSFGKFGADYLVEFYCLPLDDKKLNLCMDETGARAFVNEMVSGG